MCLSACNSYFLFCGKMCMVCSICIYFMLIIDLVLLVSSDVVPDMVDDSSVVNVAFMDS
jgi:hypothetical protein